MGKRWTGKEYATLDELYPNPAVSVEDILELLPGRSKRTIYRVACERGLKRQWSDDEVKRLKEMIGDGNVSDEQLENSFPSRSLGSIIKKGWSMGLKRPREKLVGPGSRWTKKEDERLREMYPDTSISEEEIGEKIGRSWDSVRKRGHRLGLCRKNENTRVYEKKWGGDIGPRVQEGKRKRWSNDDIKLLHELYPNYNLSKEEICHKMDRDWGAIYVKAGKEGILRPLSNGKLVGPWSEGEVEDLKRMYPDPKVGWSKMEEKFGKRKGAIKSHAARLGLKRPRTKYIVERPSYFYDLDEDEKAYWVGFIAADGSVKPPSYLKIELNKKDICLLERLRSIVAPEAPITPTRQNMVKLSISHRDLFCDLGKWGVIPNKTYHLEWPSDLPESMEMPYILGYFDGDGSFCQCRTTGRWIWALLGRQDFLMKIKEKIEGRCDVKFPDPRKQSPHLYKLSTTGKRAEEIAALFTCYDFGLIRKRISNL